MSTALYLYNVTTFFSSGAQIAVTGVFAFASSAIAYFLAPALGEAGKKYAAMAAPSAPFFYIPSLIF